MAGIAVGQTRVANGPNSRLSCPAVLTSVQRGQGPLADLDDGGFPPTGQHARPCDQSIFFHAPLGLLLMRRSAGRGRPEFSR